MLKRYKNNRIQIQENKIKDSLPKLTKSLENNIEIFKGIFIKDNTFIVRELKNLYLNDFKCCIFYIDGMVNAEITNKNIIQPIMSINLKEYARGSDILDELKSKVIYSNNVQKVSDIDKLTFSIFYGDTVLLVEGFDEALVISSKGWQTRAIEEPDTEKVLRGPREGFTESLTINLSLIRRRIKNKNLKFEYINIGKNTRTRACICYLEGVASEKILNELLKRLKNIDIDGVLDTGYIQEMIKDSPASLFETIGDTERPDSVAGKLLEGRIAVLLEGSPDALTLPYIFLEYFQVNEDYYSNYIYASINRLLRIICGFLTISVPAIYAALITFHQEMIPTPLLMSISAARQGVPFPTIVETLLMLFIFEVLREAGTRMPSPIGQAVSIVGALVLGQAAVEARIVSAPIVIVTALTGITSLLFTNFKSAVVLVRLAFLLISAFLGLYGYILGVIVLFTHLVGIRSFGVPYMVTIGSLHIQDIKDTAIRFPWWYMYLRPRLIVARNFVRKRSIVKNGGR